MTTDPLSIIIGVLVGVIAAIPMSLVIVAALRGGTKQPIRPAIDVQVEEVEEPDSRGLEVVI